MVNYLSCSTNKSLEELDVINGEPLAFYSGDDFSPLIIVNPRGRPEQSSQEGLRLIYVGEEWDPETSIWKSDNFGLRLRKNLVIGIWPDKTEAYDLEAPQIKNYVVSEAFSGRSEIERALNSERYSKCGFNKHAEKLPLLYGLLGFKL